MKNDKSPGCGQCGYGHTPDADCQCPCHYEEDRLTPSNPTDSVKQHGQRAKVILGCGGKTPQEQLEAVCVLIANYESQLSEQGKVVEQLESVNKELAKACSAMLTCHDADEKAGTNGGVSPESAEMAREALKTHRETLSALSHKDESHD